MPQLQRIKDRIRTISNLKKVTTAMELVTKTKINRVRRNADNAVRFEQMFRELYETVVTALGAGRPGPEGRVPAQPYVIGFFSQRGFCGDFNHKALRALRALLDRLQGAAHVVLLGRRSGKWAHAVGADFLSLGGREAEYRSDAAPVLAEIEQAILHGEDTEVHLVYNKFISILEQKPTTLRIFPPEIGKATLHADVLFEPDLDTLSRALVRGYLEACFERAYWESVAGENAARLLAMKNANDNASMILDDQRIVYNKVRQAKITQELSEIVSAFDVLNLAQGRGRDRGVE